MNGELRPSAWSLRSRRPRDQRGREREAELGASRLYIQKLACRLRMQKHRGRDGSPVTQPRISKQMLGEPADIAVRSSTCSRGPIYYIWNIPHATQAGGGKRGTRRLGG